MAVGKYGEAYPSELNPPQGFGAKLQAANSGDKVMGMKADQFAMLFGRLANAIAPNSVAGRMGEAVAQEGGIRYGQRREDEKPENRVAAMRVKDLESKMNPRAVDPRMTPQQFAAPNVTNLFTAGASMSPAGPNPTPPQPMSFAQALGQQAEEAMAPTELEYKKATTEGARKQVDQLQLLNEKLSKLMPSEIKTAEAGARTAEVGASVAEGTQAAQIQAPTIANQTAEQNLRTATSTANVAEATEPQRIAAAGAELNKLYQEGQLLEKSNQYFKQMNIDIPGAQLSLAEQRLQEDVKTRRSAMFSEAAKQFSALTAAIDSNTIKTLEKASTREAPGVLMHAGTSLLNEGINYYNQTGHLQDIDLAGSRKTQLGATITTGMNYIVDGINRAKNVGEKIEMTNQLIGELDGLRAKGQSQVADAYEAALFRGQGPLAGKITTHTFAADEVYNPALVLKAYRSGVK